MRFKRYHLICAVLTFVAILGIYYYFDPSATEIFPKCILHDLTGYQCPSCGSQRALHTFLHGRICEAVKYNFFALYSVPYFLLVLICYFSHFKKLQLQRFKEIVLSRMATLTYVFTFFTWWIVRNIINI